MDIGTEQPMITIEPIEIPVPDQKRTAPPEPSYEPEPVKQPDEELVPA